MKAFELLQLPAKVQRGLRGTPDLGEERADRTLRWVGFVVARRSCQHRAQFLRRWDETLSRG